MHLSYWELFFLDLTVLATCVWMMLRYGKLTVLHPASLYIFFHAYSFTFRLFQLANGAPTLFETWGLRYLTVSHAEIQRASLVALATLITMTGVWIYLTSRSTLRSQSPKSPLVYRPFSKRLMWLVVSFTLPAGLIALILLRVPILFGSGDVFLGGWTNSSYLISIYQWFGVSLLALFYYYGVRPILVLPLIVYLIVGVLSFSARVMVVVPVLFVLFSYLRRNRLRWRRPGFILAVLATILVFIPGKGLGSLLRRGDFVGARELLVGGLSSLQTGTNIDSTFMDMMAVTMTQVDERGRFYYGGTYSPLLVLPIPRALWPDKPGQSDWRKMIQTPWRPTGQIGAIATVIGEAYANFGYPGIIAYAVILAFLLNSFYGWVLRAPYYSLVNFWSLCIYAILIQVFRDGLISFVVYHFTILLPLTLIILLHLIALRRHTGFNRITTSWYTVFDRSVAYLNARGRARYQASGPKPNAP